MKKVIATANYFQLLPVMPHYLCRLKKMNPWTVLPCHNLPFMQEQTLAGTRKDLYILMKIIKARN